MKRLLLGIAAASLFVGVSAITPASALPAAPGAIADPMSTATNIDQVRYVCWWRYGRQVCAWRGGPRWGYGYRRHWRHRRW